MEFVMYVGLPGSGKSHHARMYALQNKAVIVSSDAIRAELWGDEAVQGDPSKVFRIARCRIRDLLQEGKNVILDATNMNAKKRASFMRDLKMFMDGYTKVCIVMATPFEECVRRDSMRSRRVGKEVISKMRASFQMPYYNEGWDRIYIEYCSDCEYPVDGDLEEMEATFDQKNKHHTLTLGDHHDAAYYTAIAHQFGDMVQHAAVYHDIGKLFTQTFDGDGEAHYYEHDSVGAYEFITLDTSKETSEEVVINVAALITWHILPYHFGEQEDAEEKVYEWCAKRGFSQMFASDLWALHLCDIAAH